MCGAICLIGQVLYDNTKLTPGHITSLFVVIGALLDAFGIYDNILEISKVGASLPITSFGHSLMHASLIGLKEEGVLGIFKNIFDLTSSGISFVLFIAIIMALIFKPKEWKKEVVYFKFEILLLLLMLLSLL